MGSYSANPARGAGFRWGKGGPASNHPPSNSLRADTRSAASGFWGRAVSRSWGTSDSGSRRSPGDRSFQRPRKSAPQLQGTRNIFRRRLSPLDIPRVYISLLEIKIPALSLQKTERRGRGTHMNQLVPFSRRPLRLDFDDPINTRNIVTKAAPFPIFRFFN